ncbi:hypothetical protein BGZ73_003463 [Actinomortierella ambigua]|nr:hypothetical protein BGZ73_003463 [Actinomortierella ambigua]
MSLRHHSNATLAARTGSFLAACAVALVSGTPYLYSTYGNQLTSKLNLSGLASNVVAAGIHYGLFLSGEYPYRLPSERKSEDQEMGVITAFLLMVGYAGLSITYAGVFGQGGLVAAFLFLVFVGMGSQCGYMVAVSTNNHNFHASRGLAMGIPIAGFGLSALLFAQVSSHSYPDDTQGFLMFVSITIGATILAAVPLLRIFTEKSPSLEDKLLAADEEVDPTSIGVGTGIGSVPICHGDAESHPSAVGSPSSSVAAYPYRRDRMNTTSSTSSSDELLSDAEEEARRRTQEQERLIPAGGNLYASSSSSSSQTLSGPQPTTMFSRPLAGFALFRTNRDAQLLWLTVLFMAGPCLMYIGNVGNVVRSVYRSHYEDPSADPTEDELVLLQKLQNHHVSTISLFSCLGRISVGLMSDIGKRGRGTWWGVNRVYFMLYAAICVWIGQTMGAQTTTVEQLTKVSMLVGLGYGSMFGVAPTIASEWFGQSTFGTNWGWISLAPAIGSQTFNLIFGSLYDAEARHEHTKQCFGPECYRISFVLGACSVSLGILTILYLALRTKRAPQRYWN